jgi:nickel/cobalt transporter (NicO) family protein
MSDALLLLTLSAAAIGFIHTVIGPDHYIPFIMMARAQQWSRSKTLLVTFLCGIGHVSSSVILGAVGIAFGVALRRLEIIEAVRGDIAAWILIAFGIVYGAWGLKVAYRKRSHEHSHAHEDGTVHEHGHSHFLGISHENKLHPRTVMTTWTLFTIFVLGPCEPLIPLLMSPAATESTTGMILVSGVFAATTISTMIAMVWLVSSGIERLPMKTMERFTHAIAGGVIALSGLAIQFLGL